MPRVIVNISDDMKSKFEKMSKETSVSQSALMCLAMKEYLDQKEAINQIGPMMEQMKLLVDMKEGK